MLNKVRHSRYAAHNSFALSVAAFSFLTLVLLTSTEVFSRFGFSPKIWIIIYAISIIFIAIDRKQIFQIINHSWPVFLLPVFALISTLWSEVPERSLYASLQLLITTLIAVWIAVRFSAVNIFTSLMLATAVGVLASLANNYLHFIDTTPKEIYVGMEITYSGIYNQKNVFGKVIDLLVLSMIVVGIRFHKLSLAVFVCVLLWIPLSWSKSAGSILIYLITMIVPFYWWLSRNSKNQFVLFLFLMVILLSSLLLVLLLDLDLVNDLLLAVGKDSTLTGRTQLWSTGLDVFSQYPIFGVGYQAFWVPGAFEEVQKIHSMFLGQPINGFHNAYIEVLVALGLFGFSIFILLLVSTLFRSLNWYMEKPSAESLGTLFFVISTIVAMMFDVIVFRQHEIFYMLIIIIYIMAGKQLTKQV